MQLTAADICNIVNGELVGDPNVIITKPEKIEEASQGDISFLANLKYEDYIYDSLVSALLVPQNFEPRQSITATLIKVKDVYAAVATLLEKFNSSVSKAGIADTAILGTSVSIDPSCQIMDYTFIGPNSIIGKDTKLYPQVYIGENVKIGKNCILYPGVKVLKDCIIGDRCILHSNAVVGSDGFGYARKSDGSYSKIPQLGNVILENDVEIGSNTTIDRAVLGSTIIHKGVKLDNLIQIAHNVEIGEYTAMAAQSGVAGSTKIGAYCQIGGQAGIVGHIEIPDGTRIQAQSGVTKVKNSKGKVSLYGSPAIDYSNYLKSYAVFKNLPELLKDVREIKNQIVFLNKDEKKD